MKKIVMGMAALACAASMFAVDISSTVKMSASIAGNNGDDVEFFKLNKENQKDSDALIFSANTEKAGAQFQLWYQYDGENGEKVYTEEGSTNPWELGKSLQVHGLRIRNVNLWFKPLENLKVTVGDSTVDSYKEMIFWWHGVYGEQPGSWGAFGGEYIGGNGFKIDFSPIAGLDLTAAIYPGAGNAWLSTNKDAKVANYAVKAKYSNIADMPISAAVVFADKGAKKLIGIGADYGSPWSGNFYAFLNVGLNITDDKLTAISFDNYEKYTQDALVIAAHLPVSIYGLEGNKPEVGMHATVKATYAMDGVTPYLLISNERDGDAGWKFNDAFKFAMTFQPGVTFNVGACGFDLSARIDVNDTKVNWSVPCSMSIGL